jgi:hypothetical protein
MTGVLVYDNVEHGVTLEVETANIYQSGRDLDSRCGILFFPQKWNLSGMRGARAEVPDDLRMRGGAVAV